MKKVELLAPAGNFDGLMGALCAGADAVYLGGEKFGARAYADNFTEEEILRGIRIAHIWGKRVYLTLNVLLKEKETAELYDFLKPLYLGGLDGVIVQDLGVVQIIRTFFPDLPVHASTQMTVTGPEAVRLLQEKGVTRVVPARELSLEEIRNMKDATGIEVEAFIHGAMCYCYSGQCLFSSILGGRSGNRGRCAQPCRLPYSVGNDKEFYPLSMKDMCTLELLPELIEAGIDSFKIEGRMKKPVYAAGVTAIYRKYIDLYQSGQPYRITAEDRNMLSSLYIRSEISEGYYHQQNGKDMITLTSPSYRGSDDALVKKLEETYLDQQMQLPVKAFLILETDRPVVLKLQYGSVCIQVEGAVVQEAKKQPLTREQVLKQLNKTGNAEFYFSTIEIRMDGNVFVPVRELNELRRQALWEMGNMLIQQNGFVKRSVLDSSLAADDCASQKASGIQRKKVPQLHVLVSQYEQLHALLGKTYIDRLYLDYTLLDHPQAMKLYHELFGNTGYLAGPYIIRKQNVHDLQQMAEYIQNGEFAGVLFRNMETFAYFQRNYPGMKLIPDANIYIWNHDTFDFFGDSISEFYLPVEQNLHEWKELLLHCPDSVQASAIVYGRLPMMISANCIAKTTGRCLKQSGNRILTDRYGKNFPVWRNCKSCYNIIYNSVPLSLHAMIQKRMVDLSYYRMDFTLEGTKETSEQIQHMYQRMCGENVPDPKGEYTTGHSKRGVE